MTGDTPADALGVRACNVLRREGITTWAQLAQHSREEMLAWRHSGPRLVGELLSALAERGLAPAAPPLSERAEAVLADAGLDLGDLVELTRRQILALPGSSRAVYEELRDALHARGLAPRPGRHTGRPPKASPKVPLPVWVTPEAAELAREHGSEWVSRVIEEAAR